MISRTLRLKYICLGVVLVFARSLTFCSVPSPTLNSFPSLNLQECLNRVGSYVVAFLIYSSWSQFCFSRNFARILVSHLVETSNVFYIFSWEEHMPLLCSKIYVCFFALILSNWPLSCQFRWLKQLIHSSSIRDQAHLQWALSHSSGTCSGWLKALPQPALGLAHDFTIALLCGLAISCSLLHPCALV